MITYQQEFLSQVDREARPLLEKHWQDIALNKDKIKLNPDWDAYYLKEEMNQLKIFTARNSGVLVGYFVVFTGNHLHYKDHIFATNDIIYMHPDHRKGFVGIKLIKFAEKCLKEDNISVLHINTKFHKDFSKVLERLGFAPVEAVYGKFIGE
jgi:GNAT superfamily N-acetyltransferase